MRTTQASAARKQLLVQWRGIQLTSNSDTAKAKIITGIGTKRKKESFYHKKQFVPIPVEAESAGLHSILIDIQAVSRKRYGFYCFSMFTLCDGNTSGSCGRQLSFGNKTAVNVIVFPRLSVNVFSLAVPHWRECFHRSLRNEPMYLF